MQDRRGNPVATASMAALDAAEQALWRMMSFYGTPLDDLDAAIAADPKWLLPPLMKAGFLLSLTEPAFIADARALLQAAEPLAASANDRERAHFAALRTLLAGDWLGACAEWEALLQRHPRDALALQWAHLFDFYRGDANNLCRRVARVLPEWDDADPLQPYVLGLHAFGLEENHLYAQAEDTGRRALAGAAKVPWAIHAVAHVMEMQGRFEEGSAWMAAWQADWAQGNGYEAHLGWHHALFALEALDFGSALEHFDAHLAPAPGQVTLQRLDAASLLWRLHLLGVDTGSRWQALAAGWDLSAEAAGISAFNDLHALLALIGTGDLPRAQSWMAAVAARSAQAGPANREMAREVGLPLMRGMLAFALGDCDGALRLLCPVRGIAHRFGGSHAQRDLIDQTVLAAAVGASDPSAGRALLNERLLAKPRSPLSGHWAQRLGRREAQCHQRSP